MQQGPLYPSRWSSVQLTRYTFVIGFSPQRRFHRESPDRPDQRSCVEEELTRTFQVRLSAVTSLYPEGGSLLHHGTLRNTPA